jgi:hypothetical protein
LTQVCVREDAILIIFKENSLQNYDNLISEAKGVVACVDELGSSIYSPEGRQTIEEHAKNLLQHIRSLVELVKLTNSNSTDPAKIESENAQTKKFLGLLDLKLNESVSQIASLSNK